MIRDTFLPDDLRPVQQNAKRTSRVRGLLILLVVVALLSSVPSWRLRRVEISGGESLPNSTIVSRSLDPHDRHVVSFCEIFIE